MPYREEIIDVFDKGLITELEPESIEKNAASYNLNWLTLGDRIELTRGDRLLGAASGVSTALDNMAVGTALDGTEHLFVKTATKLKYWDASTETYTDVITGLPDERVAFATYRTPAGSFVFMSSPNSGLYRINLANPTSYVDLYDDSVNYRGYITITKNRMYLWGDVSRVNQDQVGNSAILRLSYLDSDWPYTNISSEALDTADGSATYSGTFAETLQVARTVKIEHSQETFIDNGSGVLSGDNGGSGTVNYTTGAWEITFGGTPPGSGAITGDYSYEQPNNGGITDFGYSATRVAGEGTFLFQGDTTDEIVDVVIYDNVVYCYHTESIWTVRPSADDESFDNQIYRRRTGIKSLGAVNSTGEGIYYIDTTNLDPEFKLLKYNIEGDVIKPESVSEQLDLSGYDFTRGNVFVFGDYVIFTCRENGDSYNSVQFLYNRKWKTYDIRRGLFNAYAIYGDILHGASSVTEDAYQIFSGYSNNGSSAIRADIKGANTPLDTTRLKKCKRFVVEGRMARSQELIVEAAYDNGDFVEIGRIAGDSEYVIESDVETYGTTLYGGGTYGSGETVEAFRYVREFRIPSGVKFSRVKVRFRTESIGYINVNTYIFRDIRYVLKRVAKKFR